MNKNKVEPINWEQLPDPEDIRFVVFRSGDVARCYAVDDCPACQGSGKVDTIEKRCPVCHGDRVVYTPCSPDDIVREFKAPDLSIEDVSIDYDFLIRNAGNLGGH